MAVNSKADKAHRHKVSKGGHATPSYTSQPAPSQGGAISTAGQKALMFRARKELAPLADPTQSIIE